ncbi:hypothetical protein V5799_009626 [Amblyomma americanum]|uniref:Uncharacterized protein n=1 Tax=Amblyomma americanum TaxID=6943 RepID=A0AAQ4F9V2_AMBAM
MNTISSLQFTYAPSYFRLGKFSPRKNHKGIVKGERICTFVRNEAHWHYDGRLHSVRSGIPITRTQWMLGVVQETGVPKRNEISNYKTFLS